MTASDPRYETLWRAILQRSGQQVAAHQCGASFHPRPTLAPLARDRWLVGVGGEVRAEDVMQSSLIHERACFVVLDRGCEITPSALIEAGAIDVVRLDLDDFDEECAAELFARAVALAARHDGLQSSRARERAHQTELIGMNAIVQAISISLDGKEIIRRTIAILVDLCQRGAAAYLTLQPFQPPPAVTPSEGLFSESEAEDLSRILEEPSWISDEASSASSSPRAHAPYHLTVKEQCAADRLLVCMSPEPHSSWDALVEGRRPLTLRARPAEGELPGMEPIWHRLREGCVTLLPIWGHSGPLGVLVVAELALSMSIEPSFGPHSLETIGSLLGGALENAALFAEIHEAYDTLTQAQDQLVHAEKFAAVGHLAAQIAHEINNPASFVVSNLSVMLDYTKTLSSFLAQSLAAPCGEQERVRLQELMRAHEIDFLQEDLDILLNRSLGGLQRIHQIARDLRYFAHDSGPEPGWLDVEALLEATLSMIRHDLRYRADVRLEFGRVPEIFSDANKLSQVFLNLLVNASQALREGDVEEGDWLKIETARYEDSILVVVEDSGEGIAPEILERIFEPFFTTKRRGEGTGLGLSLSRDIVRSLGGDIRVVSEVGEGSRFEILLPIHASHFRADQAQGSPHLE